MQELYVIIGKRIAEERQKRNLSQEYLAEITKPTQKLYRLY